MGTHSTPAGEAATFPIPHPGQSASDDLATAMAMLRVVAEIMGDGRGFNADFVSDLDVIINEAKDRMGPVLIHLNELDREDQTDRYAAARRKWITKKAGRP